MTPEEQETIQKSKDPSVTMTANETTHTIEEATVYVWDLDMFAQVQLLKESPAVLSLRNLCEEYGSSCEGHPGQPSFLIKSLQLTWQYHPALPPSAHPPEKPASKQSGGMHNLFNLFPTDPNCEVCRRTNVSKGAMQKDNSRRQGF